MNELMQFFILQGIDLVDLGVVLASITGAGVTAFLIVKSIELKRKSRVDNRTDDASVAPFTAPHSNNYDSMRTDEVNMFLKPKKHIDDDIEDISEEIKEEIFVTNDNEVKAISNDNNFIPLPLPGESDDNDLEMIDVPDLNEIKFAESFEQKASETIPTAYFLKRPSADEVVKDFPVLSQENIAFIKDDKISIKESSNEVLIGDKEFTDSNVLGSPINLSDRSEEKIIRIFRPQYYAGIPTLTDVVEYPKSVETPVVQVVETPVVQSVDAPVVQIVETPVVQAVETPVVQAVDAPVVQAVETPVVQAVETPVVQAVETPVVQAVETPVVQAVETPVVQAVETPVVQAVETPVVQAVETPVVQAVETPVVQAVENVIRTVQPVIDENRFEFTKKYHAVIDQALYFDSEGDKATATAKLLEACSLIENIKVNFYLKIAMQSYRNSTADKALSSIISHFYIVEKEKLEKEVALKKQEDTIKVLNVSNTIVSIEIKEPTKSQESDVSTVIVLNLSPSSKAEIQDAVINEKIQLANDTPDKMGINNLEKTSSQEFAMPLSRPVSDWEAGLVMFRDANGELKEYKPNKNETEKASSGSAESSSKIVEHAVEDISLIVEQSNPPMPEEDHYLIPTGFEDTVIESHWRGISETVAKEKSFESIAVPKFEYVDDRNRSSFTQNEVEVTEMFSNVGSQVSDIPLPMEDIPHSSAEQYSEHIEVLELIGDTPDQSTPLLQAVASLGTEVVNDSYGPVLSNESIADINSDEETSTTNLLYSVNPPSNKIEDEFEDEETRNKFMSAFGDMFSGENLGNDTPNIIIPQKRKHTVWVNWMSTEGGKMNLKNDMLELDAVWGTKLAIQDLHNQLQTKVGVDNQFSVVSVFEAK